ncbi:putative inner membrane spanin component [Bajunvirus bajun]|uniref:Inner membrane spanin component n=1 Tax=Brevundimonas phage vB_BgoS-Bajun TaxID=2948594 RepID=A0A9E7N706_9CAUD|nr:putative inner membrane spanin component [Brevundimonas phage vB_BgoS-Bajun]
MHLLFTLLFNPASLIVYALVAAAFVAVWFILGPVRFWLIAKNWKTWALILGACAIVSYSNMAARVDKAEDKVEQVEIIDEAKDDNAVITANRNTQRQTRNTERARQQEAITNAAPGQELDDLLDEIARQEGRTAPGGGKPAPEPERVRDGPDGVVLP